jgi:hypothetical protein
MRFKPLPLLLPLIALLWGCHKDKFETDRLAESSYQPEIAAPVINSDLGVYDIMAHTDSSEVQVDDSNGLVSLVYDGRMYSFEADSLVNIPNQDPGPYSFNVPSSGDSYNRTATIDAGDPKNEIDSLHLKGGRLNFDISTDMGVDNIEVRIPGLRDANGNTFAKNFTANGASNISKSYSLQGYRWDLTDGGSSTNTVRFDLTIENPNSSGQVDIDPSIKDLAYEAAFGDFGDQQIAFEQDSIVLRVFKNSRPGVFQLNESMLQLDIENSFGFPVGINVDTLRAIDLKTGNVSPINYSGTNPFIIDAPSISDIGSSAYTKWLIDSTNSDISTVVNSTPKYIHHAVSGGSNPSSSGHDDFITDQSRVRIRSKLKMPLVGYAHSWSLVDTVQMDIGEERFKNVQEVLVRTLIDNGFPFSTDVQLYMADADTNVIDSVYKDRKRQIRSASVDDNGKVTSPTTRMTSVTVDGDRKQNLLDSEHLIIEAKARTYEAHSQKEVSIYDDQMMNVKLGLKVKGNFSFAGN